MVVFRRLSTAAQKRQSALTRSKELSLTLSPSCSRLPTLGPLCERERERVKRSEPRERGGGQWQRSKLGKVVFTREKSFAEHAATHDCNFSKIFRIVHFNQRLQRIFTQERWWLYGKEAEVCDSIFLFQSPTGLFIASGTFDTPLISVLDEPILKPFGVVIVITVKIWFGV